MDSLILLNIMILIFNGSDWKRKKKLKDFSDSDAKNADFIAFLGLDQRNFFFNSTEIFKLTEIETFLMSQVEFLKQWKTDRLNPEAKNSNQIPRRHSAT